MANVIVLDETKLNNVKATEDTDMVIVEDVIIKQVSSPATIQRVAIDRDINPQEVYVRVIFEHEGKEYSVSNKLRFLTKAGYNELLAAKQDKTPMRLAVHTNSGFFYIEKDVSVDDLFKTAVQPSVPKNTLAELLLGGK